MGAGVGALQVEAHISPSHFSSWNFVQRLLHFGRSDCYLLGAVTATFWAQDCYPLGAELLFFGRRTATFWAQDCYPLGAVTATLWVHDCYPLGAETATILAQWLLPFGRSDCYPLGAETATLWTKGVMVALYRVFFKWAQCHPL